MQLVAGNRLLGFLPTELRTQLALGARVELRFGETLCEAGAVFHDVYFPLDGSISMLVPIDRHPALELGLIGNEGMLGVTDMLGVSTSPWCAVVQGAGSALRLSPVWQSCLRRYVHLLLVQQSRITACSHYHRLEQRLARWLLMSLDRTAGDIVYFSHRFLADMLGVQRSAVTLAAGDLQRIGAIRYVRGEIRLLDRACLQAHACSCYQTLLDDDAAVFPTGPTTSAAVSSVRNPTLPGSGDQAAALVPAN
jgi:CRP-like cAMP-binding protein